MSALKLSFLIALACAAPAAAAPLQIVLPDWQKVAIVDHDLGQGVHAIESFGGNIGLVASDRGVLLVDAGYPQLHKRLLATIRRIDAQPVRLVIDTHFHWDHTGGNSLFAREGAIIVASDRTRACLLERQDKGGNRPGEFLPDPLALPQMTVPGDTTLHWGDQTIRLIRLPGTHTDGDLIVQFVEADVIQTGDALMTGFYPFIDVSHGGGIDGMIALCDRISTMAGAATRIVPGHGAIGTKADVEAFGVMLRTVRERVAQAIAAHVGVDDFVASDPLRDLEPKWGGNLIKGPVFARTVYGDLPR